MAKSSAPIPLIKVLSGFTAIIFAVFALIFTVLWMKLDDDDSYLGGLNTNELLFNWHPVLMVTGLILCSITSLVSFKVIPLPHLLKKYIHASLHSIAVLSIILGLLAVFQGNNNTEKNIDHINFSNLVSLHSFLGLSAVIMYGSNYLIGLANFLLFNVLGISDEFKASILPYHIFLGTLALIVSVFAVETGVMELSTELGVCEYEVTQVDTNPAKFYYNQPGGCKLAYGIGMSVFFAAFFTFVTVFDSTQKSRYQVVEQ